MGWLAVSVEVGQEHAEALADALLESGAVSVEVTDADAETTAEVALFAEPGEVVEGSWRGNRVVALFAQTVDVSATLDACYLALGLKQPANFSVDSLADRDWIGASQRQFEPVRISERLWIVPSWCEPPNPAAINLRLDPGLAFGTGSHPTTWQCLCWLDEHLERGTTVLDYGCGSGILAIAAAKLGATRVLAIDIDENAVAAGQRNAEENSARVDFALPDTAEHGMFDVVVANILANPLRVLAPLLAARVRPSGRLVLAGILERQAAAVVDAYEPWFELQSIYPREGWTCLTGVRKLTSN